MVMMPRTMLGWSKPFNTSISPHTLASFPLTFFFGMTFKATSLVNLLGGPRPGEGERERALNEDATANIDFEDFEGRIVGSRSAILAPRSAMAVSSAGTCHVAF
jgi:hypothetical protein